MTQRNDNKCAPDHTAVRVALWRALHARLDARPLVFEDEVGAQLAADHSDWLQRPDMNPQFSKPMRASIVGRARYIEDLVTKKSQLGVRQYVILGAGLDTFALRRSDLVGAMQVFEVDQPGPQTWKRNRLKTLGFSLPASLHFVPVDFEIGESWLQELTAAGFQTTKPAVVVSTGVSMYLSREANLATLRQVATLAPGSTLAMTFMLALHLLQPQERGSLEYVMKKAAEGGTPFLSLFTPEEILALAKDAGFKNAQYVSGHDLYQSYFAQRTDGLRAGDAEAFLVATI